MKALPVLLLVVISSVSNAAAPVYNSDYEQRLIRLERMLNARSQVELFTKLQALEQQVKLLNGIIDEQSHQISQLEKRQQQFMVDFDKRLKVHSNAKTAATPTPPKAQPPKVAATNDGRLLTEDGAYHNAYQLIQMGDYEAAIRAFRAFLEMYPNKKYAVNAHYWLGELYLAKQDYSSAESAFNVIIHEHADHIKAPDALVKLGFLYQEKGDITRSESIFNQVLKQYPGSSAANLAMTRLQKLKRKSGPG